MWARNCKPTKASPQRGQGIVSLRKLAHAVGKKLQACENLLQRAARNRRPSYNVT